MQLIVLIFLKTTHMKQNWKTIVIYVIRIVELIVTGAIGGTIVSSCAL